MGAKAGQVSAPFKMRQLSFASFALLSIHFDQDWLVALTAVRDESSCRI